MDRWIKSNKCSIRQELEDLPILRIPTKELIIKPKWEILCTMETLWRTLGKAMLGNKLWIISILNSIMEASHLKIWTTRTLLIQVIEMVQARLASILVELEAIELELLTVFLKIIRLIYSTWSIREKLLMVAKTMNNKWWWLPNSSLIQLRITIRCFQAWILHKIRGTLTTEILRFQRQLPKLNLENRELIVVLVTQFTNNMRIACQ